MSVLERYVSIRKRSNRIRERSNCIREMPLLERDVCIGEVPVLAPILESYTNMQNLFHIQMSVSDKAFLSNSE